MKSTLWILVFGLPSFLFSMGSSDCPFPNTVIKELNLPVFVGIASYGPFDVEILYGEVQSVVLLGDGKSIENTDFSVKGGVCVMKLKKRHFRKDLHLLVKITSPDLEYILLSGSGNVVVENLHACNTALHLQLFGSGDLILESLPANIRKLSCELRGSGNISFNFAFALDTLILELSGSGDIHCSKISSKVCSVDLIGSGDVSVGEAEVLNVRIIGSGDIYYTGTLELIRKIRGNASSQWFSPY